jgi:hypothetical protein
MGVHMDLLKGFGRDGIKKIIESNELKKLLGGDEKGDEPNRDSKPPLSPDYERLNNWIESRIGSIDPSDPKLNAKLDRLLAEESSKYPSPQGKLVFTPSGNDTIVTGDTKPFKNRIRRQGGTWEGKLKRWVIKNKRVSEADVKDPNQLAGLKTYIYKMPYRKNLEK